MANEEENIEGTPFSEMYDFFLAGITDDMFMELTPEDTQELLQEILLAAIPHFEFPKKNIFNVDLENSRFLCLLDLEEKMILRQYMIVEWIGYQLASIENIRQRYSGSDFRFTSQAAHIDKLIKLQEQYKTKGFHLQRLYKRRRQKKDGSYESTFDLIMKEKD